jgi:hypothetical protein
MAEKDHLSRRSREVERETQIQNRREGIASKMESCFGNRCVATKMSCMSWLLGLNRPIKTREKKGRHTPPAKSFSSLFATCGAQTAGIPRADIHNSSTTCEWHSCSLMNSQGARKVGVSINGQYVRVSADVLHLE